MGMAKWHWTTGFKQHIPFLFKTLGLSACIFFVEFRKQTERHNKTARLQTPSASLTYGATGTWTPGVNLVLDHHWCYFFNSKQHLKGPFIGYFWGVFLRGPCPPFLNTCTRDCCIAFSVSTESHLSKEGCLLHTKLQNYPCAQKESKSSRII